MQELIERVEQHPRITVHLQSEFLESSGFVGNFTSRLRTLSSAKGPGEIIEVRHGATIVATGGVEYRGPEYGYGRDPRIITQQELEERITDSKWQIADSKLQIADSKLQIADSKLQVAGSNMQSAICNLQSVVMIQCVGPAEKYCSRICCTSALKHALALKQINPDVHITILYRDVRAFGLKERLYQEARRQGVMFVRYDFDRKPTIEGLGISDQGLGNPNHQSPTTNPQSLIPNPQSPITNPLTVRVWEPSLGEELELHPDLLVLSMPVVPPEGADELATRLKVPQDLDGFFLEAHVKLRPVDFASDGIFMAGMAHYPKFLDETIAQAQAAASRALTILSKDVLQVGGVVAQVDADKCVGCLTCVRICPYDVPQVRADFSGVGGIVGAAYIEPAQCHGCGICVAECPAKAIQLLRYRDVQLEASITALLEPEMAKTGVGLVPEKSL